MWKKKVIVNTSFLISGFFFSGLGIAFANTTGSVTFTDIAANNNAGINYSRTPSTRNSALDAVKANGTLNLAQLPDLPLKARGAPGVALFDFDSDGDLDIYVTNGPNTDNSLYSNQLQETGVLAFVDVAGAAGVAVNSEDSTGVCYGDIDNDNDQDLLVLNFNAPHSLFENQGNGTFTDISVRSQLSYEQGAMSCAMGDIDGDGLLDIAIANLSNIENLHAFALSPFAFNSPNQLFVNDGNNEFTDVSGSSGILYPADLPAGVATLTWAVTILDYDLDGDQDILFADDQAGLPGTADGGADRGYMQLFQNDGNGQFTAIALGTIGEWMGISAGDLNCDGQLDIFGSNFGDYSLTLNNPAYTLGASASRWLLGQSDGSFSDPGVGNMTASVFGWGTSVFDYDNDGDSDVLYHGGMDLITTIESSNGGTLLRNQDCSANFTLDENALANSTNHGLRNVQGVATGDLNNDGFVDIISVSNFDTPETVTQNPFTVSYGAPFDDSAFFIAPFIPISATELNWSGLVFPNGTLSVEINSADNGNHWAAVDVMGTIGITSGGQVNRDGIGAVVTFTPRRGKTVMQPILGGSSYASQNSLTANFGLGHSRKGSVDVIWPSGVKNRLDRVRKGQRVLIPEIPCSYDGDWASPFAFRACLDNALYELLVTRTIKKRFALKLRRSMLKAFWEPQY